MITGVNVFCSTASLEFLKKFSSFSDFYQAVEDLTEKLADAEDDPACQLANTIEKCRMCGIWSAMTDNDHVLINDTWHTACPSCLWSAFERADLHVDPEMKNTRFIPLADIPENI